MIPEVSDLLHFDHTAIAATRIRDLLPLYQDLLGGTYYIAADNPRVGYRCVQLTYGGGGKIELMEPLAGSTFFDSFFRRFPSGGVHHVTFHAPDLDPVLERLRAADYSLTGLYLEDPAQREVFVHPRESHGVLIQISDHEEPLTADTSGTMDDVLAGRMGNGVPSP